TATVIVDRAPSTIAALFPGMKAEAVYRATPTGNNATKIFAEDKAEVEGTITAIDTTSTPNTVTITPRVGSAVTLDVSSATITLDGGASAVGALAVGMKAEAYYTLTGRHTGKATRRRASDRAEVEGTITAI